MQRWKNLFTSFFVFFLITAAFTAVVHFSSPARAQANQIFLPIITNQDWGVADTGDAAFWAADKWHIEFEDIDSSNCNQSLAFVEFRGLVDEPLHYFHEIFIGSEKSFVEFPASWYWTTPGAAYPGNYILYCSLTL